MSSRPKSNPKQLMKAVLNVADALINGEGVSEERKLKRLNICARCDKVKNNGNKVYCGICGCRIRGDRSLINLARFEETPKYGCRHPEGSQWKKQGV